MDSNPFTRASTRSFDVPPPELGLESDIRWRQAEFVPILAPLEITSPLGVAQSARLIRRLIVSHHIDLVHSFSATASVAINLALRVRGANGLDGVRLVSSPMGLQNSPRELPVTSGGAARLSQARAEATGMEPTTPGPPRPSLDRGGKPIPPAPSARPPCRAPP